MHQPRTDRTTQSDDIHIISPSPLIRKNGAIQMRRNIAAFSTNPRQTAPYLTHLPNGTTPGRAAHYMTQLPNSTTSHPGQQEVQTMAPTQQLIILNQEK